MRAGRGDADDDDDDVADAGGGGAGMLFFSVEAIVRRGHQLRNASLRKANHLGMRSPFCR